MSSPVPVRSDVITLGDIIHAVWQRKWLCISIVSVFFLVGLVVSIIKSPKYTFSQTLVNASVPTGSWDNDPRAMRDGSVFANYLERHNDKVMQRNDDALDMKIGVAKPGSLSVTLKTEAPESRVNEVRSRLDDALKILNDYQQPWLAITHQSLVRSVDLDQQAISDLQQRQRDLARSTKLVVTHSMPSPDAILSAAHSSGPSAPPHETSTVTESLERIANAEDAQLMLVSANVVQQMLEVKQDLVAGQVQLSLIQPAHFIGEVQCSKDPVGMSSKMLVLMFTVLGVMVAVFVSLLLAFSTSRSSELTNES